MARSSNPAAPTRPRWVRRLRRLAILGAVIGLLAATREQVLRRDQRRFDAQYGTRS